MEILPGIGYFHLILAFFYFWIRNFLWIQFLLTGTPSGVRKPKLPTQRPSTEENTVYPLRHLSTAS